MFMHLSLTIAIIINKTNYIKYKLKTTKHSLERSYNAARSLNCATKG